MFTDFLKRLDRFRTWGRGCLCHEEALRLKKPVDCRLKGRRLREAAAQISAFTHELSCTARSLTITMCENDQELYFEYGASLRLAIVDLGEKFAWPGEPPYAFANITEQATVAISWEPLFLLKKIMCSFIYVVYIFIYI